MLASMARLLRDDGVQGVIFRLQPEETFEVYELEKNLLLSTQALPQEP